MSVDTPTISIIIPVYNGMATLPRCLTAVFASTYPAFECIVVDDGSRDASPETAVQHGARVVRLPDGPHGPAYARNEGARVATGALLYFVDADVVIYPDTLAHIAAAFRARPDIDALFGSYDELPGDGGFLSQYRNLQHHFVHQQGMEDASTFWSGCGAIRRQVFLAAGGFDSKRYPRPSIEDIDLGYRLRATGSRIWLHKALQVKHLKRWSFRGMLRTDVFDRAIPWTRLIVSAQNLPDDLNLGQSQRISAFLVCLLLLGLALTSWLPGVLLLPLHVLLFLLLVDGWRWEPRPTHFRLSRAAAARLALVLLAAGALAAWWSLPVVLLMLALTAVGAAAGALFSGLSPALRPLLFAMMLVPPGVGFAALLVALPWWVSLPLLGLTAAVIALNPRFYRFFLRQRGLAFALATIPLQMLYYLYSVISFVAVTGHHHWHHTVKPKFAESLE